MLKYFRYIEWSIEINNNFLNWLLANLKLHMWFTFVTHIYLLGKYDLMKDIQEKNQCTLGLWKRKISRRTKSWSDWV